MSRRKVLSTLLWIWLVASPIIAAYVVSNVQGIMADRAEALPDSYIGDVQTRSYNSSMYLSISQSFLYDNESHCITVASLAFAEIDSMSYREILISLNENWTSLDTYKIVVSVDYVGQGNLTEIMWTMVTPGQVTIGSTTDDVAENYTWTYELNSFQALSLHSYTGHRIYLDFQDLSFLPVNGDYVEIALYAYEKETILSQAALMQYVLGSMAVLNFIFAVAMTPLWNPLQNEKNYSSNKRKSYKKRFYRRFYKRRR